MIRRKFCTLLLMLALMASLMVPALADGGFTDVPDSHWASSFIQRAYEADWVHGMGEGKYDPSGTLTGAQFLTMVTNAFFSQDVAQADVPDGSPWYAACWSAAQANDLQMGTSIQDLSDLSGKISRYDMAQVIVNTLASQGISASGGAAQAAQGDIQDWSSVPAAYRDAVAGAYALGILNGRSGNFDGQALMTRAEAAKVLCGMGDAIAGGGSAQTPGTQQPDTSTQQPGTGTQKPDTSTQQPGTGTQKPDASTQQPGTGTQKPDTSTQQPGTGTQKPDTSTQQPETGTQKPTTPAQTPEELTAEVVRLVNEERAKEGLAPLGTYNSLTKAAQIRAPEIVTLFAHDRPDGTKCYTAMDQTGASKGAYTMGENIAAGHATAAETVEQWMNSPGHRANILNPKFTHIGVGYQYSANSTYRYYWVQMFAGVSQVPDGSSAQQPGTGTQKPDTSTQQPGTGTQKPDTSTQQPGTGTQKPDTPAQTPEELTAEVVRLVNEERAKEGLAPLGTYDSLTKAAQIRAPEIVTLFAHDRPDGTSCFTAMDQTGAKKGAYTWGENIAAGHATAAETVEQWMNSPGHRANILNPDYTHIGVGYQYSANSTYRYYWVQMFTGTRSVPDSGSAQTPGTSTQTPGTFTQVPGTSTQNPGTTTQQPDAGTQTGGLLFSCSTITLYPGGTYALSVLEQNMRPASGVTWTNESPDLLRLNGSGSSVTAIASSGTGYLTASRNGETIRLTVRIIPTEDQITLSCLSTTMQVGGYGSTELYVFSTSRFYGQNCTVSWSVDDPGVLTLEERISSQGNPSVRFQALRTGDTRVTCRVTMADGTAAEQYCFAHVR